MPDEKLSAHPESGITSATISEVPPTLASEPTLWLGEEGPNLPERYGITLLQALPRDPHWAYVYWELAEETKNQIIDQEGEWVFDVMTPVLMVFDMKEEAVQEIPVLLDAQCWYVCLPPSQKYSFEIGLKDEHGKYISLIRSNWIKLPPVEPSHETGEEEWSIMEERYEELLRISGGMDVASLGGSVSAVPHILRHRKRIPWKVPPIHEVSASGLWSGRPYSGRSVSETPGTPPKRK